MKRKRLVSLTAMALLLLAVVVSAAAAAPAPQVPIEPNYLEVEPNDDFDSAIYFSHETYRHGAVNPAGDVDFYRSYFNVFDSMVVEFYKPATSPLSLKLSLYDESQSLVSEVTCDTNGPCLYFVAAEYGDMYLRVTDANGAGGPAYEYRLRLHYLGDVDANEPNDFMSDAAPIAYDQWVYGIFAPCGDLEYFTFNGEAGDNLRVEKSYWYVMQLLDAEGNLLDESGYEDYEIEMVLPQTGAYYLYIPEFWWCNNSYDFNVMLVDQPLYVSFSTGGTISGIPFTSGDVLRYWMYSDTWEMYIDMSDLGLKGNLTALSEKIGCDLTYVFGFAAAYKLPGVGTVLPQDLVSFWPEAVGPDTEGYLEFYLDGSDVGLTTTGERIDAVSVDCWYYPVISTVGTLKLPSGLGQATYQDEDVMSGYMENWGTDSSGLFWPYFDGSDYGLGPADVIGMDDSPLRLSFDRTVKLSGITFAPGDIAECADDDWNVDDPCETFVKFFDASDAGVGSYRIDAFAVGPKQ